MARQLSRSLVFVPGNNPRFLEKARSLPADIACIDLEDSVPGPEKARAREMAGSAVAGRFGPRVFVRTNAPASGAVADDLGAVVRPGLEGIVVPKVDDPSQVSEVAGMLSKLEEARGAGRVLLMPSIESARGVANAHAIAAADPRVCALVFGVFDLLADLGVEYSAGAAAAAYPRAKVALDARAAGVDAIDAIWQDLGDAAGLEADCRAGRQLGYAGKSVIHPSQIPAVHGAFHPDPAEVLWAQKVCRAYEESAGRGRGATLVDGKMIDEVHYRQARALLGMPGDAQ